MRNEKKSVQNYSKKILKLEFEKSKNLEKKVGYFLSDEKWAEPNFLGGKDVFPAG